jgi:hypothetical protein
MSTIHIFLYLQVLDLLTTLVGFKVGAAEASPFIRALMHMGPAMGVAASKVVAIGLGGLCIYMRRAHLIRWISYWYGAVIVWNLAVILVAAEHLA